MENRDKARSAVEPAEALGTTDEVDETSKSSLSRDRRKAFLEPAPGRPPLVNPARMIVYADSYARYTIVRPGNPIAVTATAGESYLCLVWPQDGLEQYLWPLCEPQHPSFVWHGAATIEALAIRPDGAVVERTWTINRPNIKRAGFTRIISPHGRGWEIEDDSHDKWTSWKRRRTWSVVREGRA